MRIGEMKAIFKIGRRTVRDEAFEFSFSFRPSRQIDPSTVVGDWIVYYQAGAVNSKVANGRAYVAVAFVDRIVETSNPRLRRAYVKDFVQFENPVPFKHDGFHYESGVIHDDGSINGSLIQHELRPIAEADFLRIVDAGLSGRSRSRRLAYAHGEPAEGPAWPERSVIEALNNRTLRDRAFADQVYQAYDFKCAVTGSDITDPTGRFDLNAAHIWPVAFGGPDSVRNGLSLISSVHKAYDLGWLTITDDLEIVVSDFARRHPALSTLKERSRLIEPKSEEDRPHPVFLEYHRERIFEHWRKA